MVKKLSRRPAAFLLNRKLRFLLSKNAPQRDALRVKEYGC